jgi:hypothetical protein
LIGDGAASSHAEIVILAACVVYGARLARRPTDHEALRLISKNLDRYLTCILADYMASGT